MVGWLLWLPCCFTTPLRCPCYWKVTRWTSERRIQTPVSCTRWMAAEIARRGGLRLPRWWLWRLQFLSWTHEWAYQGDQERSSLVPHLTRFKPLRVMAVFGTCLREGRGSEPVWFRGLGHSRDFTKSSHHAWGRLWWPWPGAGDDSGKGLPPPLKPILPVFI